MTILSRDEALRRWVEPLGGEALRVRAAQWTAILPAAGRGSRLGASLPKPLVPVGGRPMIDWVVDALRGSVAQLVVVAHPEFAEQLHVHVRTLWAGPLHVCTQPTPAGTADAVWHAKSAVVTRHALVLWGDQVGVTAATVAAVVGAHSERPEATLTLPTLWRRDPYIALVRDGQGRLSGVRQAREGEVGNQPGENDAGLFAFDAQTLWRVLDDARARPAAGGVVTGEVNLLQLLPRFEGHPDAVVSLSLTDPSETLGVNTADEAAQMAALLSQRAQRPRQGATA